MVGQMTKELSLGNADSNVRPLSLLELGCTIEIVVQRHTMTHHQLQTEWLRETATQTCGLGE
jgi:hypothetical protein